jgi:chromosome segregation ATPase
LLKQAAQAHERREQRWRKEALTARSAAGEHQVNSVHLEASLGAVQVELDDAMAQRDALSHELHTSAHELNNLKRTASVMEGQLEVVQEDLATAHEDLKAMHQKKNTAIEENERLQKKVKRIPDRLKTAGKKTLIAAERTAAAVSMKFKGTITEKFRNLYRSLLDRGVATTEVNGVVHDVADAVGVSVTDNVSAHSVRRANTEGYVQGKVQVAVELSEAERESQRMERRAHTHI